MLNKTLTFCTTLFLTLLFVVIINSCANMAAPTGGAYDVDPPEVVRATPDFNALNATPQRIEILFDENIKIESPSEKVIITPPQQNMPVVRALGRRAVVELNDELLPNTTYTIDFTDAIVDNNESNPLENFVYSFSTGDQLDTLSIAGRVLNAEDLEPMTGFYVGIHSVHDDTVFINVPFERISRTDSRGNFVVRGMAPGDYRVFALNDLNRDYRYDNPQEEIAFLDSIVAPYTFRDVRQDTIFVDSVTVDTVLTVEYTRFMPDDLLLRSFLSDFQRQFLQRHERAEQNLLNIFFGAPTSMPTFSLLNPEVIGNDWYVLERNLNNDSLRFWITDSLVYQEDSIRMKINYIATDTLDQSFIATDTLNFNFRRSSQEIKKEEERRLEEEKRLEEQRQRQESVEENDDVEIETAPIRFMNIQTNVQSTFELFNPVRIVFEHPVVEFDSSYVDISIEIDSVYESVPFRFETDSLNPRSFVLRPIWEPGGSYKIQIDSASVFSVYGIWNNTYEQTFTLKPLDQYGNLEISLTGLPQGKQSFVQLLDNTGKPFRKSFVIGGVVRFQDLTPGDVYARLIIDENEDGVWTTGNYEEQRQPEEVFYYPGKFVIRAYSDHLEQWSINETTLINQKPLEITINKPVERTRRNPNLEREQQQQQQQSSPFSGIGGGIGGMR